MQNAKSADKKPPVNWGYEIKNAFRIIGKVLFKILSYILNILLTIMLISLITGIIVGSAMAIYVKNYVDPEIDMAIFPVGQDSTTRIFVPDKDGGYVELEEYRLLSSENSIWAGYQSMPENLINAFVAIEDRRFFQHNGVDIIRLGKAVQEFLTNFTFESGGSTITQQLIKNVTGDDDVRVQRKIEEIFRALNLETKKTKTEILELYLNIVPLGKNCIGVQSAANFYFGKDVSQLTLLECACIASITNNPTQFDPTRNPEGNKLRRDLILKEMYDQGYINKTEFDANYKKDITLYTHDENEEEEVVDTTKINSYFKDALIDKVIDDIVAIKGYTRKAASMMLYTGGLQIYTTLDSEIQEILEEFYEDDSNFKSFGQGIQPESAMVVIDPYTGYVVGLVGGRGEKTINRGLNRATGTVRPPGSSIKPISVYAPALDEGRITYGTPIDDAPVLFNVKGKSLVAWPKNLPEGYDGLLPIHEAIRVSKNTIAVRVLEMLSLESSFKFLKEDLSIDSLIEEKQLADGRVITDKDIAPLALGQLNYGLTVEEITAAYAIFQNDGMFNEPRLYTKIYDSLGNLVIDNDPKTRIAISSQTASIMTIMLQDVVKSGTAKCITLQQYIDVAGKTGTSGTDYDRWFVGYTPYYVGGVWFGYDMPQSLNGLYASTPPPCLIWDAVMTKIHQKYIDDANNGIEIRKFELAAGVITAEYCKDSGKIPTDACRNLDPRRESRIEVGYFTKQTAPSESCDVHVVVDICDDSGGISIPGYCYCPNTHQVALIRVETRSFKTNVGIADAGYVYRQLPEGVKPSGQLQQPFFKSILGNEYVGVSSGIQYNRLCIMHCPLYSDYVPPEENEPETEAPVEESPPDDISPEQPDEEENPDREPENPPDDGDIDIDGDISPPEIPGVYDDYPNQQDDEQQQGDGQYNPEPEPEPEPEPGLEGGQYNPEPEPWDVIFD